MFGLSLCVILHINVTIHDWKICTYRVYLLLLQTLKYTHWIVELEKVMNQKSKLHLLFSWLEEPQLSKHIDAQLAPLPTYTHTHPNDIPMSVGAPAPSLAACQRSSEALLLLLQDTHRQKAGRKLCLACANIQKLIFICLLSLFALKRNSHAPTLKPHWKKSPAACC